MADCELLKGCIFFTEKMKDMPSTTKILKEKYCRGDNSACARHKVFVALGRENVPHDLFPGMTDKAQAIIARNTKR